MTKLDYYYFPSSHWSRVISVLISEKRLEPERHVVDIRKNETFAPWYMRLNGHGVVPTLVEGGRVIRNSPRIAAFLDGLGGPEVCVADGGWAERLEDFPLMHLSYSVWVLGHEGEKSADILADKIARARRLAEEESDLRDAYLRKGNFFAEFQRNLTDRDYCTQTEADCRETLYEMATLLEENEWLAGNRYSFADAIATSILYRLIDLARLDEWSQRDGALSRYYERLRARPSFEAVYVNDPLILA